MHMFYFPSRVAAGELIADKLEPKYRYEDCAVLALGDGSVVVGAAIAKRLHCVINMLILEPIQLPREPDTIATINNFGEVLFNDKFSPGELEAMKSEFFNYIEQQKTQKLFELNALIGSGGITEPDMLRYRNVVVVSDGLLNGFSMRAAAEFLKPIKVNRLIMVTPFASVQAVDQMHILADEIICLNVMDSIISIDHYYDDSTLPDHETVIRTIQDIILQWK